MARLVLPALNVSIYGILLMSIFHKNLPCSMALTGANMVQRKLPIVGYSRSSAGVCLNW